MSTTTLDLGTDWLKIADATEADVSLQLREFGRQLEVAATEANEPTTPGHIFPDRRLVQRDDIGTGHLYARLATGPAPAILVITK